MITRSGLYAALLALLLVGCGGEGDGDGADMSEGPLRDAQVERPEVGADAAPPADRGAGEPDFAGDEGAPTPDRGSPDPDRGVFEPDEGSPALDEGVPEPDRGSPDADAEVPDPDQGSPDGDADVPDPDQGSPDLDADVPDPDQGSPDPDLGVPDPDRGSPDPDFDLPDPDEGLPEFDLGPPDPDAGPIGPPVGDGCGLDNPFPGVRAVGAGRRLRVEQFPSGHIRRRDVSIWLPEGYAMDRAHRYPVLYMHDGQNLFEAGEAAFGVEWQVDETVDALTEAGVIEPMIVVGLHNTAERVREYTPSVDPGRMQGGEAGAYARFIVEELKPWVEHSFLVRCGPEATGLAGSSLGGLVSLYIAWEHPGVFGRVAALSPSLWWNGRESFGWVDGLAETLSGGRLWLDGGNGEGDDPDGDGLRSVASDVEDLVGALRAAGMTYGSDLGMQIEPRAPHNEGAWAGRLPDVMTFLWGAAPGEPVELMGGPLRWPLSPGETAPVRVDAQWLIPLRLTAPPTDVELVSQTPAVATVDGDAVTAVAPGEAQLIARYAGLEGVLIFDVVAADVTPIEVTVPATTPADATIYLAGSDPAIGGWAADGFALNPQGDGRWTGVLPMPLGTRFEYKVTRGTWETVEKGPNNEELPNRVAITDGEAIVIQVEAWRDDFE